MFSSTAIAAALAILAISVSVVDTEPTPPEATTGATHTVAADGSGDFASIQAAVDAAADGDTVLVRPGVYVEAIVIAKDITLRGDGPRADVIVTVPEDGPLLASADRPIHYAFHLLDADASIGDLTITGSGLRTTAVVAMGGSPTIHDLSVDLEPLLAFPRAFAFIGEGAEATIRDNEANAELSIEGDSMATVTGNDTTGPDRTNGLVIEIAGASDVHVSENRLNGIVVHGASARLDGNEISAPDGCAIDISGTGTAATVLRNTIRDSVSGICTSGRAVATIESNDIFDNGTGVSLGSDEVSAFSNDIHQNDVGVFFRVGSPTVEDNTITRNRAALAFGSLPASPTVSGNSLCQNETSLELPADQVPPPSFELEDSC